MSQRSWLPCYLRVMAREIQWDEVRVERALTDVDANAELLVPLSVAHVLRGVAVQGQSRKRTLMAAAVRRKQLLVAFGSAWVVSFP